MAADALGTAGSHAVRQDAWPWLLGLPFPVRGALRRWRGMVGMVLGVGMALGLVMTLTGLVGTALGQLLGDFQESGANVYVAVQGGTLIPLNRTDSPGTIDHATAVLSKIRSLPGVQAAVGEFSWSLQRQQEGPGARNRPAQFIPAIAVDGDPSEIANFVVMHEGRWLRRGNELVLGQSLSASTSLRVGDSVRLNGQEFEIVGIGKLRGFGQLPDLVAYVDARALRGRGVTGDIVNYVAVQTSAPRAVRTVADDLSLRAVSADELAAETTDSPAYRSGAVIYDLLDLFILFVAGMFVSNMLARSAAERRMEFGTLRAIGLPRRTILLSVVAEGLVIIVASFVVGVGVSLALGKAINVWVAPLAYFDHLFAADPATYLTLFALSLGLGLLASFLPARAATKVDPLDVLREA